MVEEYNDFIENKLCGDSGNCDYSNYTKEQVNDLRSEIEKALENGNNLVDLYGKISDYYTENQDAACTETKEMITKDLENIQNMNMTSVGTGDDPQSGINKLNMALNALSERAKTLEDEALQEQIAQLQTKNDKLAERNEHYYKVLQQKFFADVSLSFKDGCDMITPKLKDWLIRGLDIMKIVALILTLILGMVDFFKGVASGNADTMKKVWTSFSRRLIAVALLFLLPVILEFILGLVSIGGLDSANPLCGLK